MAFQVFVLNLGPALPGRQQLVFQLATGLTTTGLLCAAAVWVLGVISFEKLVRVTLDTIEPALGIHDVGVRLLALLQGGFWRVNRPLIDVLAAQLAAHEVLNQTSALIGRQFTRQGHFDFSVGRTVRALIFIGGSPEVGRRMLGPLWHIAVAGSLKVFIPLTAAIFPLTGNVCGVRSGLAFRTDLRRQVIGGHAVDFCLCF